MISVMFQKDHVAPEYCKHAMMTLLPAALGSRKHCSCYLGGFDGANLANSSKNLPRHVMSVLAPKQLTIGHTAFSNHSQFPIDPEPPSPSFITSLPHVDGHDMLLVIVDWFSKMAHFVCPMFQNHFGGGDDETLS